MEVGELKPPEPRRRKAPRGSVGAVRGLIGICRLLGHHFSNIDQVVGDHAEPDKAPHTVGTLVATAPDAVAALKNADATFAAGPPFLGFLEPPLFLALFTLPALGGLARDGHAPDAQFLSLGFVGC